MSLSPFAYSPLEIPLAQVGLGPAGDAVISYLVTVIFLIVVLSVAAFLIGRTDLPVAKRWLGLPISVIAGAFTFGGTLLLANALEARGWLALDAMVPAALATVPVGAYMVTNAVLHGLRRIL